MMRSAVFSMLLHQSGTFSRSSVSEAEKSVTRAMDLIAQGLTPQQAVDKVVAELVEATISA